MAAVPLKKTTLFVAAELKFVPVIVTDVPGKPEAGVNEVIVGAMGSEATFITTLSREPVTVKVFEVMYLVRIRIEVMLLKIDFICGCVGGGFAMPLKCQPAKVSLSFTV